MTRVNAIKNMETILKELKQLDKSMEDMKPETEWAKLSKNLLEAIAFGKIKDKA
jgi:hypothetical protein